MPNKVQKHPFIAELIKIRTGPLALALFIVFSLALISLTVSYNIKELPEDWVDHSYDAAYMRWKILETHDHQVSDKKIYIVGGSQILQGFPARQFERVTQEVLGPDVHGLALGFGSQSMLESFLILSNVAIDENTIVFVHFGPDRLYSVRPNEYVEHFYEASRLRLLDRRVVTDYLMSTGHKIPDTAANLLLYRFSELKRLFNRESKGWDLVDVRYRNPAAYVSGIVKSRLSMSKKDYGSLVDPKATLAALTDYVTKKGGRVFYLEMPFCHSFPDGVKGWEPESHTGAVRAWLEDLALTKRKTGFAGEAARLTPEYYKQAATYGDRYVSMDDPATYSATSFCDSIHMTKVGRDIFLPRFFDMVKHKFQQQEKM